MEKITTLCREHYTLLTPSRRVAAYLRTQSYAAYPVEQRVWPTPLIFPLEDWYSTLWEQYEIAGLLTQQLLNSTQALLLMESIIQGSDSGKNLLRPHATAKIAWNAWNALHDWDLQHALHTEPETVDQAAFQEWAQSYAHILKEKNCVDKTAILRILLPLLQKYSHTVGALLPRKGIVLYGFEELSPATENFFQALKKEGWEYNIIPAARVKPHQVTRYTLIDQEQETIAAAQWAKALWQKGEKNIAIVVPHLADLRSEIDQIFRETFHIEQTILPSSVVCPHYTLSAGTPLIQLHVVMEAMACLALNTTSCGEEYWATLLFAYIAGSQTEQEARQLCAGKLKKSKVEDLSLSALAQWLQTHGVEVPSWYTLVQRSLATEHGGATRVQSYAQWAEYFFSRLALWGWPGERRLNSIEYQAVDRFYGVLQSLMLCDQVLPPASYRQAYQLLYTLTGELPFQAENTSPPIHVLGLLEGTGQIFDHLWVMGMHSEAWPPSPAPNPFLPIDLQRQYHLPHACAARELAYAQKITQGFLYGAKNIVFSSPAQAKESILTVSALIEGVPEKVWSYSTILRSEGLLRPSPMATVPEVWVPVQPEEGCVGSVQMLTLQAACPFKAFAQIRLHLTPSSPKEIWLSPAQQGTVLHRILEAYWKKTKKSSNLCNESIANTAKQLSVLIDQYLPKYFSPQAPLLYKKAEKKRLFTMLEAYLDKEREREPFEIIEVESRYDLHVGSMPFTLRIDRIEKTAEGVIMVLDYKTGKFSLQELWGARPKAPQLALYYLATQHWAPQVIGVIKLSSEKTEYLSVQAAPDLLPGASTDLPVEMKALGNYWRGHLEGLVSDFQRGEATVDPLDKSNTCRHCTLGALCRVEEMQEREG